MKSDGKPPGRVRSMMLGTVRTDSQVEVAPAVATSYAISIADDPAPTTSTRFPWQNAGLRYADECRSSPVNEQAPGQAGMVGTRSYPVATTTWVASIGPAVVCTHQAAARRSIRCTLVARRRSILS